MNESEERCLFGRALFVDVGDHERRGERRLREHVDHVVLTLMYLAVSACNREKNAKAGCALVVVHGSR